MAPPDHSAQFGTVFQMLKNGQLAAAEKLCRKLAAALPRDPRPHALLARVLATMKRPADARVAVDAALAIDPDFVPAVIEDAQLARDAKDLPRAVGALEKLVALQPANVGAIYDLGATLLDLGRLDEAERELGRAVALVPGFAEARFKLGHIAIARGNVAGALEQYARCCELKPDWIEPWINRGLMLMNLERPKEAAAAFARALAINPDHVRALDGYAEAQRKAGGDLRDVIAAHKRMAELEPDSPVAWFRLALTYDSADLLAEHAAACERVIECDPDFLPARWDRMQEPHTLVFDEADRKVYFDTWVRGLEYFEHVDFADPKYAKQHAPLSVLRTNFYLHYLGKPLVELQARYAKVMESLARALAPQPAPRAHAPSAKIRVAFASGFIRRHTVTKLFRALIDKLPRDRFEITVLHFDDRQDEFTAEMRAHCDHFFEGNKGLAKWIELIAAHPLDALVYLDIGMFPQQSYLMGYRLAPLQCALWGHPITTGSKHIDCFLTSDAMEPEHGDAHYTERLVRLPRLGTCYAIPDKKPDTSLLHPARGEPGTVHYFLGQTIFKLAPIHDEVLARIAERLPEARFSLLPHPRPHVRAALLERMRRAFDARGLSIEKHVHMFPYLTESQFMGVAGSCDVNLDSIGWSGGNTTLEITWLDVPTVSLPGDVMRARHTGAMLKAMGLDELIARDVDDYVRIAVELGRDAARRERLRAAIAERKHVLYEDAGVVDAFARFLEDEVGARRAAT